MKKILIALGLACAICVPAMVSVAPMQVLAEEPPVVEPETPFVEKILIYETAEEKETLTLITESVANLTITKYDTDGDYVSFKENGTYKIENNVISFEYISGSGNNWKYTYNVLDYDLGIIQYVSCGEVEPETPIEPETPVVPEWVEKKYSFAQENGLPTWLILTSKKDFEMQKYTTETEYETIKGTYLLQKNTIVLFTDADIEYYVYQLKDDGTFDIYNQEISLGGYEFKTEWAKNVWTFLNAPLPIIGTSILIVGVFVLIIFLKSSWGKKSVRKLTTGYNDLEKKWETKEQELNDKIAESEKRCQEMENELNVYKDYIVLICENSRNKNLQDLKENIANGKKTEETKETIDTETKEE